MNALSCAVGFRSSLVDRFHAVRGTNTERPIPGWSVPEHLAFFESVVSNPDITDILVCGVYFGLDVMLIERAAQQVGRKVRIFGVDLFSGAPCADWPADKRGMSWEAAGFGPAPTLDQANKNAPYALLIQSDAAQYMRTAPAAFDFIYLDTSHDAATVRAEINAATIALRPHGLLAGDDYTGPDPSWGVADAVKELLPHHVTLFDRIWLSNHPARK